MASIEEGTQRMGEMECRARGAQGWGTQCMGSAGERVCSAG